VSEQRYGPLLRAGFQLFSLNVNAVEVAAADRGNNIRKRTGSRTLSASAGADHIKILGLENDGYYPVEIALSETIEYHQASNAVCPTSGGQADLQT